MKLPSFLLSFTRIVSSTTLFFYLIIWLMLLLIIGTIMQKYVGLYIAHQRVFTAWIFWGWNWLPLPGGLTTLSLTTIGLMTKLLTEQWNLNKLPTIAIHIGALFLLIGSAVIFFVSDEGSLVIKEGHQVGYYSDYHDLELVVIQDGSPILFNQTQLVTGQQLTHPQLPFPIVIETFCYHCQIDTPLTKNQASSMVDVVQSITISPLPLLAEEEQNHAAIRIKIDDAKANLSFSLLEIMSTPITIPINGKDYQFHLRHARTPLPFTIKLKDFNKISYPGTSMAKSYESHIILKDQDIEWPSLIAMNTPLRYKGFSIYQASFYETDNGVFSIFAVVHNQGRYFPYIASIIIALGLLMHLYVRLRP